MTKHSQETRIAVVLAIAAGASIKGAAREHGVGPDQARKWYRAYLARGFSQVLGTCQSYSREFKMNAIEYRWRNQLSFAQAAADLGIPADGLLYVWEKIYLEQGPDGLQDTRKGRPPSMSKPAKPKKHEKPLTREQELEAENARLRMENDYLKKLNALVAERERSEKKTKS